VIITFFDDHSARQKRERDISLDELGLLVRRTSASEKARLPWLKFARFGGQPNPNTNSGSLRWNGNVEGLSGVVADYDGMAMTPEAAVERLDKAGIDAIVYTSPSHRDAAPKWRVGCPFSAELPPECHYEMMARLNGLLGGVLAAESFTLSQSYYFGSVDGNPEHRALVVEGVQTLDRADELDETAVGKPNGTGHAQPGGSPEASIEDIRAALDVIPNPLPSWDPNGPTWSEWNVIGMSVWRASGGSDDGFKAFDEYSKKWPRKYDGDECEFHWKGYCKSPPNQVGFGTLVHHAREAVPGWRPPSHGRNLPAREIRLHPGQREQTVDALEEALLAADCGLYRHGSRVVEIAWHEIAVADGGRDLSLQLAQVSDLGIVERLSSAVTFKKYNLTQKQWVTCDAPKEIAQTYLDRAKKRLPVLLGVVTAPTLRHDGSILQLPGYDERSRTVFEPNGVCFPPIPEWPTKREALAALGKLKELIAGYEFAGAGRSVALSCILTAVVRSALPSSPGHGFDAPVAGSGKTKLFDIASVIATGHQAPALAAMSGRGADEELYKQLAASILAGDRMILLDNVEIVLNLPLLCQVLTETKVNVRVFGRLKNVVSACTAMVGATGNNLAIAGDNMRRWMIARVEIDVERPELREFSFDPVEEALKRWPELVVAALTVVRAYWVSGERSKLTALGSFEKWSRRVREALVWLGEADPVKTMEAIREEDPAAQKRHRLMELWPFTGETTVAAVIAHALERIKDKETGEDELVHPDLHAAVMAVAVGKGGGISGERLGWWLRSNKGRVVSITGKGRCRIVSVGAQQGAAKWLLQLLDPPF
jgi:hypothetical protein